MPPEPIPMMDIKNVECRRQPRARHALKTDFAEDIPLVRAVESTRSPRWRSSLSTTPEACGPKSRLPALGAGRRITGILMRLPCVESTHSPRWRSSLAVALDPNGNRSNAYGERRVRGPG